MGPFSFLKKNKKNNTQATSNAVNTIFDAVTESVTAYKMMEEDKASKQCNGPASIVSQPQLHGKVILIAISFFDIFFIKKGRIRREGSNIV